MKRKPLLLDLFCGAGGASMGYYRAGFDVVGIDKNRQKNYPFGFLRADVMEWLPRAIESGEIERFDVIAASPPCQYYTELPGDFRDNYPDLIGSVRELLILSNKPYIIENVRGARRKMGHWVMLCGWQFGLKTYRHRYFETKPLVLVPPHLVHPEPCPRSGRGKSPIYGFISVTGNGGAPNLDMPYLQYASTAMDISWMTRDELSQAIPPAYTRFIGKKMLEMI
jgi:DNA (cytosine-5)-methyltransferase 1